MARRTSDKKTLERKQQILTAALTVFTRKGYGESTVPDIAGEAGVAVGTIYNYFESKHEILTSLMIDKFYMESLLKMLEAEKEQDEYSFTSKFLKDRLSWGFENVDKMLLILSEVKRNDEVWQKWVKQILQPTINKLTAYVKSKMDEGVFERRDPDVVARAMAGMGMGFIILYSMEGKRSPISGMAPDELAKKLTDLIINGLRGHVTIKGN